MKSSYKCASNKNKNCIAWQNVKNILEPIYDPYSGASTDACIGRFKDYLNGRYPTASEYRAAINVCQDVNPCNTFLGIGFNPTYQDTPSGRYIEHFTGIEFVVNNNDFKPMINEGKAVFIPLPTVP